MNTRRLIVPLIVAAIALPVCAQSATRPSVPQAASDQSGARRADLNFQGGTLADYLKAVESAFGAANVAVSPGLEGTAIGPIDLKSVTVGDALETVWALSASKVAARPSSGSVFVVVPLSQPATLPSVLRVWPMAELLTQVQAEDALSAVQVAADLIGPGSEIKFHADTQLLMVKGSPEHIDAVSQAVSRLSNNADWKARSERNEPTPNGNSNAEDAAIARTLLAQAKSRITELENQVRGLQAEIVQLKQSRSR